MAGIRVGSKVRLVNTKGLWGYGFSRHIKKNKVYTVRAIKRTGGLLLEEFSIGDNMFGSEQGIMGDRFVLVKKRKKKTITKRKK